MKNLTLESFLSFVIFLSCLNTSFSQQLLEVNPTIPGVLSAEDILEQVFVTAGVEVLNIEFMGEEIAVGEFKNGLSHIGVDEGIVLSTGNSTDATGTGNSFASSPTGSNASDADLTSIVSANPQDVALFNITFIASSDSIRLKYSFASEEYPEFSCSLFNDVMGIFISGPGFNGPFENGAENIALIPDTDIPVSINNIHPAEPFDPDCLPEFLEFYNDNDTTMVQPVYDGYLDVFFAVAQVTPGETYNLKIAIADVGDSAFDSAFFLEAESFGSDSLIVGTGGNGTDIDIMSSVGENMDALIIPFDFAGNNELNFPITYQISGTAEFGVDYQSNIPMTGEITSADQLLNWEITPIADTETELFEYAEITFNTPFVLTKTYTIYFADELGCNISENVTICKGESVEIGASWGAIQDNYSFEKEANLAMTAVNTPYISTIEVENVPFERVDLLETIESVCLNIEHNWIDDLNIWLVAPDNSYVELSTDNGANCDDYQNTCFSPLATDTIDVNAFDVLCNPGEISPFEGFFKSEGNWSRMTHAPTNGTWKLVIIDDQNGFSGTLLDWSITFTTQPIFDFDNQWSTGQTSETITVSPEETTTYEITSTFNGIICEGSITVEVLDDEADTTNLFLTICENENIMVGGETIDINNPSTQVILSNLNGCDSVINVALDFLPTQEVFIEETILIGGSITIGNSTYTESGTYQTILQSSTGCDSLVNLTLTVESFELIPFDTINLSTCQITDYCLSVTPEQFSEMTLTVNGTIYQGNSGVGNCVSQTEICYHLSSLSGGSPYQLQSWEVNGQSYSQFFTTFAELTTFMNATTPDIIWEYDDQNFTICGIIGMNEISDMEIFESIFGQDVMIPANENEIPLAINIELPVGEHQLILTNVNDYSDTTNVLVAVETLILEEESLSAFDVIDTEINLTDLPICGNEIISVTNTCPELSGEGDVEFEILGLETLVFGFGSWGAIDTFCIQVCDDLGTCIEKVYIVSSVGTSTNEVLSQDLLNIFPNPTKNYFQLENPSNLKIETVQLFAIDGKLLKEWKISAITNQFKISEISSGMYFIKVETEDGIIVKKLIKE